MSWPVGEDPKTGKIEGRRTKQDRGWDGWMASPTQWIWVWATFGRQWRTEKPGILWSIELQRVRHNFATEQQVPEWPSAFPYFLQFKPEFCKKYLMIWATVTSKSCFCWLYGASPSLAAKNIIILTLILTIWWCPYVKLSLVLWKKVFAMTSMFSWQIC